MDLMIDELRLQLKNISDGLYIINTQDKRIAISQTRIISYKKELNNLNPDEILKKLGCDVKFLLENYIKFMNEEFKIEEKLTVENLLKLTFIPLISETLGVGIQGAKNHYSILLKHEKNCHDKKFDDIYEHLLGIRTAECKRGVGEKRQITEFDNNLKPTIGKFIKLPVRGYEAKYFDLFSNTIESTKNLDDMSYIDLQLRYSKSIDGYIKLYNNKIIWVSLKSVGVNDCGGSQDNAIILATRELFYVTNFSNEIYILINEDKKFKETGIYITPNKRGMMASSVEIACRNIQLLNIK